MKTRVFERFPVAVAAAFVALVMGFMLAWGTQTAYAATNNLKAGGAQKSVAISGPVVGNTTVYVDKTTTVKVENTVADQTGTWTAVSSNPNAVAIASTSPVCETKGQVGNALTLTLKGVAAGSAKITVSFTTDAGVAGDKATNTFTVSSIKSIQTVTFKNQTKTVKYKKLKKKAQTVKIKKATATTAVTYKIIKVGKKKWKKSSGFTINKKTGAIKVKKGKKKGTYKLTVNATAAETGAVYTASKNATIKIKIK